MDEEELDAQGESGEGEEQTPEPKIGMTEALGIGLAVGVLDLVDLIPVAGDFTDIPGLLVNWYLKHKGVNGLAFLGAEILDLIPVVQEFPTRSLVWWGIVYFDHHPNKVVSKLETAGEVLEGGESGSAASAVGAAEQEAEVAAKEAQTATREARVAGEAEGGGEAAESASRRESGKTSSSGTEEGAQGQEQGEEGPAELTDQQKRNQEIEEEMEIGAEKDVYKDIQSEALDPEDLRFREGQRRPEAQSKDYDPNVIDLGDAKKRLAARETQKRREDDRNRRKAA